MEQTIKCTPVKLKHACQRQLFPARGCSSWALTKCQKGVGVGSRREEQYASYLQDYCADELDTLDYGVLIPRYRHPSLSGVGQQIPCHLYLSSRALQMIGVLKKRLSLMPRIRQVVITTAWLSFRVLLLDLLTSYSILPPALKERHA